jgi:hypothetical protein
MGSRGPASAGRAAPDRSKQIVAGSKMDVSGLGTVVPFSGEQSYEIDPTARNPMSLETAHPTTGATVPIGATLRCSKLNTLGPDDQLEPVLTRRCDGRFRVTIGRRPFLHYEGPKRTKAEEPRRGEIYAATAGPLCRSFAGNRCTHHGHIRFRGEASMSWSITRPAGNYFARGAEKRLTDHPWRVSGRSR